MRRSTDRTTAARTFHSTRLPPSSTTTINLSEGKTIMAPTTLALPAAKASPSILSILALDLGSTTGYAHPQAIAAGILHGTAAFRPTRFEGGGMRYLRFERWLDETRKIAGGIDAVYFEAVRLAFGNRHFSVSTAVSSAGLTAWCEVQKDRLPGCPRRHHQAFRHGNPQCLRASLTGAPDCESGETTENCLSQLDTLQSS